MSMRVERTFQPVGHGGFYTEKFFEEGADLVSFCAVYDCGCFETAKNGTSPKTFEQRINNIIDQVFQPNETINIVFISHLHTDHILGIPHLLARCNVEKIILPVLEDNQYLAAVVSNIVETENKAEIIEMLRKLKKSDNIENQHNTTKIIRIPYSETVGDFNIVNYKELSDKISLRGISVSYNKWLYIPFNIKQDVNNTLKTDIDNLLKKNKPGFNPVNVDETIEEMNSQLTAGLISIFDLKEIYKQFSNDNHNEYSMTVFSGPGCKKRKCVKNCFQMGKGNPRLCNINCLYMGDFPAQDVNNYQTLKAFYGDYLKRQGLLQVPHHGSTNNRNNELYKSGKICIISAGKTDKYNHPDQDVLNAIVAQNSIPIIVTENPKTRQVFNYKIS